MDNPNLIELAAASVHPTEVVSYTKPSGETITGVIESVNVDPALGIVSFTYLAQTEYKAPPVLTVPMNAQVYVHI